jgi:hypothetical protein
MKCLRHELLPMVYVEDHLPLRAWKIVSLCVRNSLECPFEIERDSNLYEAFAPSFRHVAVCLPTHRSLPDLA